MTGDMWLINSPESLENCLRKIRQEYEKAGFISVKIEANKTRSLSQNSALHLYCKWLADELNDAGLDMLKVFNQGADIPWSGPSVKELLWKPVQKAMTSKDSTTKAERVEYVEIYEALNRHMASKFGVSVIWPSKTM